MGCVARTFLLKEHLHNKIASARLLVVFSVNLGGSHAAVAPRPRSGPPLGASWFAELDQQQSVENANPE
jgi:hypothetical protein